jgi:hypothetical protein
MMDRQVQQPAPSESGSNAPSETTTEARSERDKQVAEFLQRPVDPALLTASQSSGPPRRRAHPSKADKLKKVQIISQFSCAMAQHNTCTCATGVQSSSSSAAGGRPRHPSSSSTCLQPAGGQASEAEVRQGQNSIFCNLCIYETILKFWELLGKSEIDT